MREDVRTPTTISLSLSLAEKAHQLTWFQMFVWLFLVDVFSSRRVLRIENSSKNEEASFWEWAWQTARGSNGKSVRALCKGCMYLWRRESLKCPKRFTMHGCVCGGIVWVCRKLTHHGSEFRRGFLFCACHKCSRCALAMRSPLVADHFPVDDFRIHYPVSGA